MGKNICSQPECNEPAHARSVCIHHYGRLKRTGQLPKRMTTQERFWAKVQKTESCWLWTAARSTKGYGQFLARHDPSVRSTWAHRIAYEWLVDLIPSGMVVDHLCFTPNCVNPDHLRVATNKQNAENRQGANSTSKSGIRGVHYNAHFKHRPWVASVMSGGKRVYQEIFATKDEAAKAVRAARRDLLTHSQEDAA